MSRPSEEVHIMWARVVLIIAVGLVVAIAHGKADDAIYAMLITGFLTTVIF